MPQGLVKEPFKSEKEIKPHGTVYGLYGGLGKPPGCGEAFPFIAGFIHRECYVTRKLTTPC